MLSNGLGNMATAGTDMLTGVKDTPSGDWKDWGNEFANTFVEGALGGAAAKAGAGTRSKVINDMVENITATSVGGGLGAMRSFSQGN